MNNDFLFLIKIKDYWQNHHNPLSKTFVLRYLFTFGYILAMPALIYLILLAAYSGSGKKAEEIFLISQRFFIILVYPTLIITLIKHEVSRYSPYYYYKKWRKFCDYPLLKYWGDELLGVIKTNLWWIFFLLWISLFSLVFIPVLILSCSSKKVQQKIKQKYLRLISINKKVIKKSFFIFA